MEIEFLKKQLEFSNSHKDFDFKKFESEYLNRIKELDQNLLFIKKVNIGGEFMEKEDQDLIEDISRSTYLKNDIASKLLDEEDVRNLQIAKGTLLPDGAPKQIGFVPNKLFLAP